MSVLPLLDRWWRGMGHGDRVVVFLFRTAVRSGERAWREVSRGGSPFPPFSMHVGQWNVGIPIVTFTFSQGRNYNFEFIGLEKSVQYVGIYGIKS